MFQKEQKLSKPKEIQFNYYTLMFFIMLLQCYWHRRVPIEEPQYNKNTHMMNCGVSFL